MADHTDIPMIASDEPSGPAPDPSQGSRWSLGRAPSAGISAALAAGMLGIGVAVGAAIGPAPSASLAGVSRLPLLLPSLLTAASPAPSGPAAAASPRAGPARKTAIATPAASAAAAPASATTAPAPSPPSSEEAAPASPTGGRRPLTLPPITNVWLIELSGSTFAGALAQPSAAPYIGAQAVSAGTLLSGWSALQGSAFASDAALLASSPPQVLDTIVQPPCPEGPAALQCAAGTPGALTAADSFLAQTIPAITANPAYRSSGLIVVTFGSVLSATATGLPAGASTATLTAQPPAGVLLISPFAKPRARPTAAFDPTSPKQSLEALLHK